MLGNDVPRLLMLRPFEKCTKIWPFVNYGVNRKDYNGTLGGFHKGVESIVVTKPGLLLPHEGNNRRWAPEGVQFT